MIPAIIHQTWKSLHFPKDVALLKQGWERLNPSFEHRFYEDAGCRKVVAEVFPDYIDDYDRLPVPVMRADVFRYAVVYRDGGVYADMDMECLKPIGSLLHLGGCVLSEEAHLGTVRQKELGYQRPIQIANCIFAAVPRHAFFRAAFERAMDLFRAHSDPQEISVEDVTGPRMLTRLYEKFTDEDVTVLPQIVLMAPLDYPNIWPLNQHMHARHRTFGTWKSEGVRQSFMRKIIERNRPPNPMPTGIKHLFAPRQEAP